jgi:hypothetical protein
MRHILRGLSALAAACALSSCDVAPGEPPPATVLPAEDAAIAAVLYAGTPRTPAGFPADDAPLGFTQVTTYHLKSTQITTPAATSFELCTDDWNAAYAWSDEVAAQSPQILDVVGSETTARYFEFDRVPRGQPDRYVRMRVFRCAYLDRAGVDTAAGTGGFAGTLNARPLDAAALRELGEYLWRFTPYNNADHAVVASEPGVAGLAHVLTIASLERAASAASCDRVVVRAWTHAADATTGALQLTSAVLREFLARRDGSAIVGC